MSNQEIIQNVANFAQIGGFIMAIMTAEFARKLIAMAGRWKMPLLFLLISIGGIIAIVYKTCIVRVG